MTFQKPSHNVKTNVEATFLKGFCAGWEFYACSLRKKCLCSELFWSAFSRIWTEYGEIPSISRYSVPVWEDMDQNNS